MFITAKVENPQGEVLDLMSKRESFFVEHIGGLTPPAAVINTTNIYGMDGAKLNSHYLGTRNIVLTMRLRGDQEASRQELYKFMNSNVPLRFYFKNQNRDVYIDGIVENIEDDIFVRTQSMQASIICPDPYFRDVREYEFELENSLGGFEFPFLINIGEPIEFGTYEDYRQTDVVNDTTNEIPFTVEITPTETLGSWSGFDIMNMTTGEKIGVSSWPDALAGFEFGDVITISTDPYHPTFNVRRGGAVYNLIPYMSNGSTFFVLHPGSNVFAYRTLSGDDNKIELALKFRKIYRGV